MTVIRKNAESLYFGFAELRTPNSDTFVMRKESKFCIKASIAIDNSAYGDT